MSRMFTTHEIRKSTTLDGVWEFALADGPDADLRELDFKYRLIVPGCWETHPELLKYQGHGVYRRKIKVGSAGALRLEFKGVSHTGKVYLDGRLIAEHYNAYTAFSAVVPGVQPGEHELAVRVDNTFSEASALHVPNDYYTYGGIMRPVVLEELAGPYVERIAFTPSGGPGVWGGDLRVKLANPEPRPHDVRIEATLAGRELAIGSVRVEAGQSVEIGTGELSFPEADSWSPGAPRLYELSVRLFVDGETEASDDLVERVGFRTIATQGERILLNGETIVFKGFNRHEDHPMAGASLTPALMMQDIDLMLDMGANMVRTSHYPNDERFLDLCDERGLLVWEENHARGLGIEDMRNPNFIWQCEQVNREMVEQHYNHPSIVIWAILNECASNCEEGRVHYERQLKQLRGLDASRPLSFASHHRQDEICFDLADIVSCNLYPGWYTDEDPGELCDLARGWADAAGGAGKPMIMSEFGGDGYYGLRDPSRVRGTEERQADIIEANLQAYSSRPYVSGMLIWQFCDCRVTEDTGWLISRAGTRNSKGIVDRYRRPKLAYAVVKKYFRES
ncbi:glycoside hydrolase family 2 protein [Cohnella boryungensis]|uniref:Glycoside hydrolase family 2 protein n=1 Tax=Cohnella boryungensis TaxID=768479 RepID=A0ABV8S3R0_9BACL